MVLFKDNLIKKCSIYGKNVRNIDTNDLAWVDIQGYKHEYVQEQWNERDASCKTSTVPLTNKQYSIIPDSNEIMTKYRFCLQKDINPALIYEYRAHNKQFIS